MRLAGFVFVSIYWRFNELISTDVAAWPRLEATWAARDRPDTGGTGGGPSVASGASIALSSVSGCSRLASWVVDNHDPSEVSTTAGSRTGRAASWIFATPWRARTSAARSRPRSRPERGPGSVSGFVY